MRLWSGTSVESMSPRLGGEKKNAADPKNRKFSIHHYLTRKWI